MNVPGALLIGCGVFVAIALALGGLPTLLSAIADPPRIKRIRAFFESAGCVDIEIKPWPNHYGVRFIKDGARHYIKCRVEMKSGRMEWIGEAPSWVRLTGN